MASFIDLPFVLLGRCPSFVDYAHVIAMQRSKQAINALCCFVSAPSCRLDQTTAKTSLEKQVGTSTAPSSVCAECCSKNY